MKALLPNKHSLKFVWIYGDSLAKTEHLKQTVVAIGELIGIDIKIIIGIWQFKSRAENSKEAYSKKAGPGDLADLNRILDYIQQIHEFKNEQRKSVKKFQNKISSKLKALETNKDDDPLFFIEIHLVLAAKALTNQASEELDAVKKRAESINQIGEVLVDIQINVKLIDHIADHLYINENDEWKTKGGKKESTLTLNIEGKMIDDKTCQIFYCPAIELVNSYNDIGQRLFAANVRCYLENTPVNQKIRRL